MGSGRGPFAVCLGVVASGVTSKAAMCGHLKTGHRGAAGTSVFLRFRDQFVHSYSY